MDNLIKMLNEELNEKIKDIKDDLNTMNTAFKELQEMVTGSDKKYDENAKRICITANTDKNSHQHYAEIMNINSTIDDTSIHMQLNNISKNIRCPHLFQDTVDKLLLLNYDGFKTDDYGSSVLHYASKYGHVDVVKQLLHHYKDIDINDNIFKDPLLIEYEIGDSVFWKSNNCNLFKIVNQRDNYYKSSIYYAIEAKHYYIACTLIQFGACVDSITTELQKELLHYTIKYITNNDDSGLQAVFGLLAMKVPEAICHFISECEYPNLLYWYFRDGHVKVCDAMLNAFQDEELTETILNTVFPNGHRIFDIVNDNINLYSDYVHLRIIQYLMNHMVQTIDYGTHLCNMKSATLHGHLDALTYIIDQCKKEDVFELISIAISSNQIHIVKFLWAKYGEDTTNNFGTTPLHSAVCYNYMEIIKYLCENIKNINVKNNEGETPYHIAVKQNNKPVALYLKQLGAISD